MGQAADHQELPKVRLANAGAQQCRYQAHVVTLANGITRTASPSFRPGDIGRSAVSGSRIDDRGSAVRIRQATKRALP